jgi:hypothetical protein
MAKTRPLPEEVYEALRKLGAPDALSVIGYRQPFAFIGVKGAAKATAAWALDTKVKCKTMLRIEATLAPHTTGAKGGKKSSSKKGSCGTVIKQWHLDQTALLDKLESEEEAGSQQRKKQKTTRHLGSS